MKIALDAMGGDFAPQVPIQGAIEALEVISPNDRIQLVGRADEIKACLKDKGVDKNAFEIIDAHEVVGMHEPPISTLSKKRNASIPVGYHLMKVEKTDAFLSAGNTGAMLVGAIYSLNTIPGIIRPAIPAIIPRSDGGFTLVLDVGSNPDARPDVLYQYALIGSVYAALVLGVDNPSVALLNIGEEEEKGSLLTAAAHRLMKGTEEFNFIGNIEARDLFGAKADVVVCDGFTGNIVLKLVEGFYNLLIEHQVKDPFS